MKREESLLTFASILVGALTGCALSPTKEDGGSIVLPSKRVLTPNAACQPFAKYVSDAKTGAVWVQFYGCQGGQNVPIGRAWPRALTTGLSPNEVVTYGLEVYIPGVLEDTLWFDAAWKAGHAITLGGKFIIKAILNGAEVTKLNGTVIMRVVYNPVTRVWHVSDGDGINIGDVSSPDFSKCQMDWLQFYGACGGFVAAGIVAIAGSPTIALAVAGILGATSAGIIVIGEAASIKEDCK